MRFSERMGLVPIRQVIQKDDIDADLRNGLWNVLQMRYLSFKDGYTLSSVEPLLAFVETLWVGYFKLPVDEIPYDWGGARKAIKDYHFHVRWYQVYDMIEFVVQHSDSIIATHLVQENINIFNNVLKKELSAYRFIGDTISPITSEEEITAIEKALQLNDVFAPVGEHLSQALRLLSDRQQPDYKNSVKESISAVESMVSLIAGKNKAELTSALDRIKGKLGMHAAFADALKKLYNYTSDENGVRHGSLGETSLDQEDAIFMLVSCSAFANYLKTKAEKAGIALTHVQ